MIVGVASEGFIIVEILVPFDSTLNVNQGQEAVYSVSHSLKTSKPP